MAHSNTDLSIVIPAFNAGRYIRETLDSVRGLQGPAPRVIVVDDGSRDNTAEIVAAFSDVTLIKQQNAGVSAARNTGLAQVDTPYVIFLDADDLLLPEGPAVSLAAIAERPECPLVFGALVEIDPAGRKIRDFPLPVELVTITRLVQGAIPRPSQTLFRTESLRSAGGFKPGLATCEDFELCVRLIAIDRPAFSHGQPVVKYRRHPGQVTNRTAEMLDSSLEVVRYAATMHEEIRRDLKGFEHVWHRRLGGYLPFEIVRYLRQGQLQAAARVGARYVATMPHSLVGTWQALSRRWR